METQVLVADQEFPSIWRGFSLLFLAIEQDYRTQSKRKSPQWVTKNPDRGVDLLKANARCTTSALQVRLKVHVEVQLL